MAGREHDEDEQATRIAPVRPRVLVCDANDAWRSWMSERLAESFSVTAVVSGRELLAAFDGGPVAAVVVAPGDLESARALASVTVPVLWMARGGVAAPAIAAAVLTPQMSPLLLRKTVAQVVASTPVRRPLGERVTIPPPVKATPRPAGKAAPRAASPPPAPVRAASSAPVEQPTVEWVRPAAMPAPPPRAPSPPALPPPRGPSASAPPPVVAARAPSPPALPAPKAAQAPAVKLAPASLPALGDALRRLALQREPRDASRVVSAVLPRLLDGDRALCFYIDQDSASAWHMADDPAGDKEGSLDGTLIGAALKTRQLVVAGSGATRGALDDPDGRGDEHLLVQPVLGDDHEVHAVIVVARGARGDGFTAQQVALLAAFAGRAAPLFDALAWDADADAARAGLAAASPFRAEAVEAHVERGQRGDVVRVHSSWVGWVYRLLCAFLLAAMAYVYFVHVDEMASGPGVVVAEGRADVVSFAAGVIDEVVVSPGQRVEVGQIVARLRDDEAREKLLALEAEFEQLIVERLAAPDDPAVAQRLASLTSQRERALAELDHLALRATFAGTAGERFVEAGAQVGAGEAIVSIVTGGESSMSLVAALPAGMRPMLKKGMTARVVLADHPGEPVKLVVAEITEDAFGPTAARRRLGHLLGDAVPLAGSVVFVRLELPEGGFQVGGKKFAFHHGMLASVDVTVRSQRLAVALVPGLKEVFASDY